MAYGIRSCLLRRVERQAATSVCSDFAMLADQGHCALLSVFAGSHVTGCVPESGPYLTPLYDHRRKTAPALQKTARRADLQNITTMSADSMQRCRSLLAKVGPFGSGYVAGGGPCVLKNEVRQGWDVEATRVRCRARLSLARALDRHLPLDMGVRFLKHRNGARWRRMMGREGMKIRNTSSSVAANRKIVAVNPTFACFIDSAGGKPSCGWKQDQKQMNIATGVPAVQSPWYVGACLTEA
jgi:hypothetical protein